MVRAYHLPDIMDRSMLEAYYDKDIVYSKTFLEFTEDGGGINKIAHLNKKELIHYFEDTFLKSTLTKETIFEDGDKIIVAFSGGRDSLSLIVLLHRLRKKLPNIDITAVTVNDCIDELDLNYTIDLCKKFNFNHIIVEKNELVEKFNLNIDFETALQKMYDKYGRQHTLYTLHYVMRHMVEKVYKKIGANKIALGLHLEDITASTLRSLTTGYFVGYPWERNFGGINYIYPLWALNKKEITLYLKLSANQYSKQGSAATFDRGTVDRDIYYAVADHSQDIWPGFAQHLFGGYSNILNKVKDDYYEYKICENCGGIFSEPRDKSVKLVERQLCSVCKDFEDINVLNEVKGD